MKPHYKIDYWEARSLDLIKLATTPYGIKASCTSTTNYNSVFLRDAVMAGIAGLLYGSEDVINGLRATIEMFHKTKGKQGQIASNFKILNEEVEYISFGTLSPKYDSATWYLVAIGILLEKGYKYGLEYVESTILLLDALEYNGHDLIYIPQGGNWADEYPYEGYVLYDQILRSWGLRLLGKHFKNAEWTRKADSIKAKIDSKYYNINIGYYNCTFNPSGVNHTFDFAAHNLIGIYESNLDNSDFNKSLDWIEKNFLFNDILPGAFFPIIDKDHPQWESISNFHLFEFKNKPHHYHNGGIWFIWIGWYALVLKKYNRLKALEKLADLSFGLLNEIHDFNFDEYITGDSSEPNGTQELCYTATGILFLCAALKQEDNLIAIF